MLWHNNLGSKTIRTFEGIPNENPKWIPLLSIKGKK